MLGLTAVTSGGEQTVTIPFEDKEFLPLQKGTVFE